MAISIPFNEQWYLQRYPDVAQAVKAGLFDARTHYEQIGKAEGRSPSPAFDPDDYLADNPDVGLAVQAGSITAADHFLQFGLHEGREFSDLFDEELYLQQNPDVAGAIEQGLFSSAAQHFMQFGRKEPRDINPVLDLGDYVQANADVARAVAAGATTAFDHLLQYGVAEGRSLGNGVSLAQFANDSAFNQALADNAPEDALARVTAVAPFLEGFQPPEGWVADVDTPLPLDFTSVGAEQLVLPPSVSVGSASAGVIVARYEIPPLSLHYDPFEIDGVFDRTLFVDYPHGAVNAVSTGGSVYFEVSGSPYRNYLHHDPMPDRIHVNPGVTLTITPNMLEQFAFEGEGQLVIARTTRTLPDLSGANLASLAMPVQVDAETAWYLYAAVGKNAALLPPGLKVVDTAAKLYSYSLLLAPLALGDNVRVDGHAGDLTVQRFTALWQLTSDVEFSYRLVDTLENLLSLPASATAFRHADEVRLASNSSLQLDAAGYAELAARLGTLNVPYTLDDNYQALLSKVSPEGLRGAEQVTYRGTPGDDAIFVEPGNNSIHGNGGYDTYFGSRDSEVFHLGPETEHIFGGISSADRFVFDDVRDSTPFATDHIRDFQSPHLDYAGPGGSRAHDVIDLSAMFGLNRAPEAITIMNAVYGRDFSNGGYIDFKGNEIAVIRNVPQNVYEVYVKLPDNTVVSADGTAHFPDMQINVSNFEMMGYRPGSIAFSIDNFWL